MMKKFVAGLLVGAMLMSGVAFANSTKVEASLETLNFFIDGQQQQQSVLFYQDRTYAPVRWLNEIMGSEVTWDGATRSIHIRQQEASAEVPTEPAEVVDFKGDYPNGVYRGIYGDRGDMQVSIQFTLTDNVLSNLSYRHLYHSGNDYRQMEESDPLYGIKLQHDQAIEYLEGKPLAAMMDLYNPGDFVDDVDTFSGATIRGNKIFSAMQDGLNRGIYNPTNGIPRVIGMYPNGVYRGVYGDRGDMQVSIQFTLENNTLQNISFRHLYHSGNDYRQMEEADPLYGIKMQHDQAIEYLEGKPLEAIFDLHAPGDFVDDVDAFSGATIRGNKVFSAIVDGLNRGIYNPTNGIPREIGSYPDGRYRGIYGDRGDMQVSIQFSLENGNLTNISFRHLYHSGNDYRQMEEVDPLYGIKMQHDQAIEYLEGKPLVTIFDLHTPGDFVDDVDAFSGATIRGNKIFSAIVDGLNRGIY